LLDETDLSAYLAFALVELKFVFNSNFVRSFNNYLIIKAKKNLKVKDKNKLKHKFEILFRERK